MEFIRSLVGTFPEKTPGQARKFSLRLVLPLKDMRGWGPDGTVPRKFIFYLTPLLSAILETVFGKHRLCKFPGIKQKEQITKGKRKSPTDKGTISP